MAPTAVDGNSPDSKDFVLNLIMTIRILWREIHLAPYRSVGRCAAASRSLALCGMAGDLKVALQQR